MSKNVLVTGANGQLGKELKNSVNESNNKYLFCGKNDLDVTNISYLEQFIINNNIDLVINCAGYTNVEKAEEEEEAAFAINSEFVKKLAALSSGLGFKVIHFSTDYVFDGAKSSPYVEEDDMNPLNVYGKSKSLGEKELLKISPGNLVIRTSWLYSQYGDNFVKTILSIANEKDSINVVVDQVGSPTYAKDLANAVMGIVSSGKIDNMSGVYHYSNEGVASWYDFARSIIEIAGFDCDVKPVVSRDYKTKARRPHYSVLDMQKSRVSFSEDIPYWRDSLRKHISSLKENEVVMAEGS